MHRQKQDDKVRSDGEASIRIPCSRQAVAMSVLRLDPSFFDRYTLEDTSNGGSKCKQTNESQESPAGDAGYSLGHNS